VNTLLLLAILLVLLANSYFFWVWWWVDYKRRSGDIEHVLRLITAYRTARTAEDVDHLMQTELLEAMRQVKRT